MNSAGKRRPKARRLPAEPAVSPRSNAAPWRARRSWILLLLVSVFGVAFAAWLMAGPNKVPSYGFEVVAQYPHDDTAYCQGLVYRDGVLYEGTGRYGQSTLRKVDLVSGKVLQRVDLHRQLFGEGTTVYGDRIIQLTWKSGIGIVYDRVSFQQVTQFRISGEGWGITHDGRQLIMSDGSPTLRFLDPDTFQVQRRLTVQSGRQRVTRLNELEYIEGEIWANVWGEEYLARISPETGLVLGWVNLRGLKPSSLRRDHEAVLNGIAYDSKDKRIFVTGKNWPQLYEIRLVQ